MVALGASTSDKYTVGLMLLLAVLCVTDMGFRVLVVCAMRAEVLMVAMFLSGVKLDVEGHEKPPTGRFFF